MTWFVALFGAALTVFGVVGVVRPSTVLQFVQASRQSRRVLYVAIGLRVVLGALLLATAHDSRFPQVFRILGIISLVAAGISPIIGFDRLQRFVQWWFRWPPGFIRAWSLIAMGFGLFLIYAVF